MNNQQLTKVEDSQRYIVSQKGRLTAMMADRTTEASDKFILSIQNAITMNPKIAECSHSSVMAVCMKAAVDGLVLDGKEAALVPMKDGTGMTANYRPMVKGLYKLINDAKKIRSFNTHVVYQKDVFDVEFGMSPRLDHKPCVDGDPGPAIGVYALCHMKDEETGEDAGTDIEFMTAGEVERIRQTSPAKNQGPWSNHLGEMARKTVIHRIAKRLPLSPDIKTATARIEELYDITEGQGAAAEPKRRGGGAAALRGEPAQEEAGEVIDLESTVVDNTVDPDAGEVTGPDAVERQDAF